MVFRSGNSIAVRLPKGFVLPCGKVSLAREGNKLVIEPIHEGWPKGYFENTVIEREDFGREPVMYVEKSL